MLNISSVLHRAVFTFIQVHLAPLCFIDSANLKEINKSHLFSSRYLRLRILDKELYKPYSSELECHYVTAYLSIQFNSLNSLHAKIVSSLQKKFTFVYLEVP
jgi:hypothetical protein